ncbi:hypothetical protein [Ruegeria conchae]|uniref:hypothetical protein n=1 Tax=Ruegeria conchae TaxID=981384 RepID=UPI0029C70B28|nr:hypothetical protein [Ruegeria conchae]
MTNLPLLCLSMPGVYFNSALLVWFFVVFSEHGLIFSISRGFSVFKPFLKCLVYGAIPGMILTNIVSIFVNNSVFLISLPSLIGVTVSAWLLHQEILANVQSKRNGNIAVIIVFLIMAALVGWVSLQFD